MAAMRGRSARGRRPRRRPSQGQGDHRPPADALPIAELAPASAGVPAPRGRGTLGSQWDASGETVQSHLRGNARRTPPAQDAAWRGVHPAAEPRSSASDTRRSSPAAVDRTTGEVPRRPASPRRGRPSVPSWDDIVFGTRAANRSDPRPASEPLLAVPGQDVGSGEPRFDNDLQWMWLVPTSWSSPCPRPVTQPRRCRSSAGVQHCLGALAQPAAPRGWVSTSVMRLGWTQSEGDLPVWSLCSSATTM